MNYCFFCLFSLFPLLITPLYAQQKVTIEVRDTQGVRLAYPEIVIGDYFHRMGSEQGTLEIDPQALHLNDTLTVRYLGYKPTKVVLDAPRLTQTPIKINLDEESYILDAVTIVPSNFSSEDFFQQCLKKALRSYSRVYFSDLHFTINDGGKTTYTGQVLAKSSYERTRIDVSPLSLTGNKDSIEKLFMRLERATEISHLTANAFCNKKKRKYFHCTYKGQNDGFNMWEFSIKKQDKMIWDLKRSDELICIVALDNNGLIKNIKIQFTPSVETDGASYLLDTEFTLFKEKLVPLRATLDLVPHYLNDQKPWSVVIDYHNHRRRK